MNPSTSKTRILFALLAVFIFWGATYLGMKYALGSFPPFLMAGLRHLSAGLIMAGIGILRHEKLPTKNQLINAAVVGILLLVGGNGLVAWSEQRLPSSIASLVISSVPFWIMGLNWIGGDRRRPSLLESLSLLMGFGGILIMVLQKSDGAASAIDPIGLGALFLAAFLWSLGSLVSRHRPMPVSSVYSTSSQMLAGGITLILVSLLSGDASGFDPSNITPQALWAMAYLILFGSVVAYSAYIWLMKHVSPTLASTYAFINPVVAVILGWTMASEVLSLQTLIAAGVIISAVVILTFTKKTSISKA